MKKYITLAVLAFAAFSTTSFAQKLSFEVYAGPQYDLIPNTELITVSSNIAFEEQTLGSNIFERRLVTSEWTQTYRFKTKPLFNAGFRTRGKVGVHWSWAVGARVQGRQFEESVQNSSRIVSSQPLGTTTITTGTGLLLCDTTIFRGNINQFTLPVYTQYQLGVPFEFAYSLLSGEVELFGEVVVHGQLSARVRRQTFSSSNEIVNGKNACITELKVQDVDAQSYFKALTVSAGGGARWFIMPPTFVEVGINRVVTGTITPLVFFAEDRPALKTFPWQFSVRLGYRF